MITFLYDIDGNLITDLVKTAILNPDVIHIKNKLLDGSYHIQTIGDPSTEINVICYVDESNKGKIDSIYSRGEPIKLIKNDKWYKGLIIEMGAWEVFLTRELYQISFKMSVNNNGVI